MKKRKTTSTERIILAVGLVIALLISVWRYGPVRIQLRWDPQTGHVDAEISCSMAR
jgi:hypothetical protein